MRTNKPRPDRQSYCSARHPGEQRHSSLPSCRIRHRYRSLGRPLHSTVHLGEPGSAAVSSRRHRGPVQVVRNDTHDNAALNCSRNGLINSVYGDRQTDGQTDGRKDGHAPLCRTHAAQHIRHRHSAEPNNDIHRTANITTCQYHHAAFTFTFPHRFRLV